jgi:hypothetical protein
MTDTDILANRGMWRFNRDTKQFEPFEKPKVEATHMVITDEMPPTQHPTDGKIYTSRAKYHAATRAYGLEYYDDAGGNDKYFQAEKTPVADEDDIVEDIKKARELLKYNEAPMTEEERQLARKADEKSIAQANDKPEIEEHVRVTRE